MGKPRAGILSMQRIYNYGSFLQAYGLKRILEELGCEVEFVDYEPGACLVDGKASKTGVVRKLSKAAEAFGYRASLKDKLSYIEYKRTYGKRFYPMLGLTESPNLDPEVDLLVIGSDEVFNCVQDNANVGFTPALFGQGLRANRKVTYAASFGNTTIQKLDEHGVRREVSKWLSELDAVSVRDANSGLIVGELTGSEPSFNLDPVLAYDYMGKCGKIPASVDEKSPYMVLYGYSGRLTEAECASVRAYADGRGFKILNIGGIQGCCDRFVDCSPFEVIAYFKGAEAVVTDTFHGTILSAITHTSFASFVRSAGYGNSQKLTDLLSRLGVSDRAISSPERLEEVLGSSVDWEAVEHRIHAGRQAAYEYLKKEVAECTRS